MAYQPALCIFYVRKTNVHDYHIKNILVLAMIFLTNEIANMKCNMFLYGDTKAR